MTDLPTLVSTIRSIAARENDTRFGGINRLKVYAPMVQSYLFQNRVRTDWHYGIPNDIGACIKWFDDEHCASYVYILVQDDYLKCTLRLSNMDPDRPSEVLPNIPKSLDEYQIAERVIASVIAGTERMKTTCCIVGP